MKTRVGLADNGIIQTTGPDLQVRIRRMARAIVEADPGRTLTPEERATVRVTPVKPWKCTRHSKFGCKLCGSWRAGGYPHKPKGGSR